MLGLRSRGVDLAEIVRVTGSPIEELAPAVVRRMIDGGYAIVNDGLLAATDRGYLFADRFSLELIRAIEKALPRHSMTKRSYALTVV
jgi:hypothetical protein